TSSTSTTTTTTTSVSSTTTTTLPLQLLKLSLTHADSNADRLQLKARTPELLAQLGEPGKDVTITVSQNGTTRLRATVPASQLHANGSGTKLRFVDSSGTIAGGITRLQLGGTRRTDITMRAQHLDLSGATAGPVTVRIDVGSTALVGSGTLRQAGSKLVAP